MRLFAFAVAALLALSVPAGAQDAMQPCKPPRQASRQATDPETTAQAQQATGTPPSDAQRQMANSAACETSPPDTR